MKCIVLDVVPSGSVHFIHTMSTNGIRKQCVFSPLDNFAAAEIYWLILLVIGIKEYLILMKCIIPVGVAPILMPFITVCDFTKPML